MSNMELLGILLTVFFGVVAIIVGTKVIKKKSQSQAATNSSIAIQSGRDTKIKEKS